MQPTAVRRQTLAARPLRRVPARVAQKRRHVVHAAAAGRPAALYELGPDDVEVQRMLGSVGVLRIDRRVRAAGLAARPGHQSAAGGDRPPLAKPPPVTKTASPSPRIHSYGPTAPGGTVSAPPTFGGQSVSADDEVEARLFAGRVCRGRLAGTRVLLKAYGPDAEGRADELAAAEVVAHVAVQAPTAPAESPHVAKLLGAFRTSTGERWLAFRNDGSLSAAGYAAAAARAGADGRALGVRGTLVRGRADAVLRSRRACVLRTLRGALQGLTHMHKHGRLHCSLGPGSVLLSGGGNEGDPRALTARLSDLAFSVDVSESALFGGATIGELWDAGQAALGARELGSARGAAGGGRTGWCCPCACGSTAGSGGSASASCPRCA